jgi:tRNA G46 methylase TrmB
MSSHNSSISKASSYNESSTNKLSSHISYLIYYNPKKYRSLNPFFNHLNKQVPNCDGGSEFQYYPFNYKGMEIFVDHLKTIASFNCDSRFLDVGSGRGNTVLCVANEFKPILSFGIEVDNNRFNVIFIYFFPIFV